MKFGADQEPLRKNESERERERPCAVSAHAPQQLIEITAESIQSIIGTTTPSRRLASAPQVFAGVYLLVHGVVKLWLVIGLLREWFGFYPVSLAVFALFGTAPGAYAARSRRSTRFVPREKDHHEVEASQNEQPGRMSEPVPVELVGDR